MPVSFQLAAYLPSLPARSERKDFPKEGDADGDFMEINELLARTQGWAAAFFNDSKVKPLKRACEEQGLNSIMWRFEKFTVDDDFQNPFKAWTRRALEAEKEFGDGLPWPNPKLMWAVAASKVRCWEIIDRFRFYSILGRVEDEDWVRNISAAPSGASTRAKREQMSEKGSEAQANRTASLIAELMKSLPPDPKARLEALITLNDAFRAGLKTKVQESLDMLLRKEPPDTYVEKQAVAALGNRVLRSLGLALVNLETGLPAGIVAERSRRTPSASSTLHLHDRKIASDGRRHRSPNVKTLAEPLKVIEVTREEQFISVSQRHTARNPNQNGR